MATLRCQALTILLTLGPILFYQCPRYEDAERSIRTVDPDFLFSRLKIHSIQPLTPSHDIQRKCGDPVCELHFRRTSKDAAKVDMRQKHSTGEAIPDYPVKSILATVDFNWRQRRLVPTSSYKPTDRNNSGNLTCLLG